MKLPEKPVPALLQVHAHVDKKVYKFPARDVFEARDMAARMACQYLRVTEDDGTETCYPPYRIKKITIEREDKSPVEPKDET